MKKLSTIMEELGVADVLPFTGFLSEDFGVLEEGVHRFANIVRKNGFKVAPVPKTVNDFSDLYGNTANREVYTEDGKWKFHFYNGAMYITDVTNALKHGASCKVYVVGWHEYTPLPITVINAFRDMPFSEFITRIENGSLLDAADTEYVGSLETPRVDSRKSVRVFSPFALSNLKRVKSLPSKPSIQHVIKLIANGQYKTLARNYSYTDDYAFDAANDHGKADNIDPIWLVQDMVTSKYNRPWSHTTEDGTVVISFGPHSNESYTLVVDLKGKLRFKI